MIMHWYPEKIIDRTHALTGVPKSVLDKHWKIVEGVVSCYYGIDKETDNFMPTALRLYENKLSSLGYAYRDALASTFNRAVAGEDGKIKAPGVRIPPVGINPEALHIWREVIKAKKKKINSWSDPEEKWGAAIIYFQNACRRMGVAPFLPNPKKNKSEKSPAVAMLASYVDPCLRTLNSMEKFLMEKRMISKPPKKFKTVSISKDDSINIVKIEKSWKLLKGEKAASVIVYMMPKFLLKKTGIKGAYRKKCGANASMVFSYKARGDSSLTVSLAVRVNNKLKTALEATSKDLKTFFRTWVKRNFTVSKAEDVPDTNESLIREYYMVRNHEEASKLLNSFSLQSIVNTGAPGFQITLAKYLLQVAKKFDLNAPPLLDKFIEDEEFRDSIRKEYGNFLPEADDTEGVPEGKITS